MKDKLAAALFCLLFAVAFGAVGVFATWMIATTIHDGVRAEDWVRTRATVEALDGNGVRYRYSFQGREFTGTRIGTSPLGGSDNIDDWQPRMHDHLAAAKSGGKPILVFVNPENPAEALVDREIRWKLLVFMLPFMLAFGGVGVGALYALVHLLRGKGDKPRTADQRLAVASDARGGLVGLWIFAFFWNAISFPIAALFIPEMVESGEWLGLFVVVFPLAGVFMLWAAIRGTFEYLRRGGATLQLKTRKPRAGAALEGCVAFQRGIAPGETFRVSLSCVRSAPHGDETSVSTRWTRQVEVRAVAAPRGMRLPFRFEIPAHLPGTSDTDGEEFKWRLEVKSPSRAAQIPYGFDVEVRPAAPEALASDRAFAGDPMPAALGPGFENLEKLLGGDTSRLDERQRAALAAMTPHRREKLAQVLEHGPLAKKIGIAVACIFATFIVVPFLIALFTSF